MPRTAGTTGWTKWTAPLGAALVAFSLGVAPALAQSDHACTSLEYGPVPAVEGEDGMFFRIDPDLVMDHRIPTRQVDDIARLSQALAEKGTTLVYVPVPTKAMVLPERLGPDAQRFGFDVALARALYADSIADLRGAGVMAVDAVLPLAAPADEALSFYGPDPRMTPEGLTRLARAIAEELGPGMAGDETLFLEVSGETGLDSETRALWQLSCQADLPELTARTYALRLDPARDDSPPARPVVLVGSTITGGLSRDGAMFLAEAMRRRGIRQVLASDAVAALSGYLTSDAFRDEAPELLIWQVPVWTNPALTGDQPMGELIAAARDNCSADVEASLSEDGTYRVNLTGAGGTLRLDAGGHSVTEAVFKFSAPERGSRLRSVVRKDDLAATPRLFLPMTGLWPEGPATVSVRIDAALADPLKLAVCRG